LAIAILIRKVTFRYKRRYFEICWG